MENQLTQESILKKLSANLSESEAHFLSEARKIRVSGLSPELVEEVVVEAYNTRQPLKNLASITKDGEQTVMVSVYDRDVRKNVISAITAANLGANPQDSGGPIRLTVPPATEERRVQIAKLLATKEEEAMKSIRSHRHAAMSELEVALKTASEDILSKSKKSVDSSVKVSEERIKAEAKRRREDILGKK